MAINMMKKLYQSCIDVNKIDKEKTTFLLKKLEEFGYWPLLHGNKWKAENFNLTTVLAKISSSYNIPILFNSVVENDLFSGTEDKISLSKGITGIKFENLIYHLSENDTKEFNAYKQLMIDVITLILQDAGKSNNNVSKDVDEILNFEIEYAKILEDNNTISELFDNNKVVPFSETDEFRNVVSFKTK